MHSATAFTATFIFNTSFLGNRERFNPALVRWNKAFIEQIDRLDRQSLSLLTASAICDTSPEEEINHELNGQMPVMALGMMVILLFTALNLGQCSPVYETRILLAVAASLIVCLIIAASLALPSLLGTPVTSVTAQVVPMLVFSVGVDNVFIIVKTFYRTRAQHKRLHTKQNRLNVGT